jgi:IS66 C-terminal element
VPPRDRQSGRRRGARCAAAGHVAHREGASDSGPRPPARYGQNDREIALGRKNHLFAGSDGGAARWAIVASLLATAKLNDVDPFAYLKDVLERLSDGHPMSRLEDLLPWNWAPLKAAA